MRRVVTSRSFYKYFIVRFMVTFSVLLAIFLLFIYQIIESRRDLARSMAQETVAHVEIILNNMLEKTDMLEGFLHSMGDKNMRIMMEAEDGQAFIHEFNFFSSMLYDSSAIKGIFLLPKGVMRYSYPMAGNEKAMGDRVLERDATKETAQYAMLSGLTTIDGPRQFIQGGIAMVARNPVYLEDGTFWGFSAISLALPDVVQPFGLTDLARQGYEYLFTMTNQNEAIPIGSTLEKHTIEDCVSYSKLISGRRVTLSVVPKVGWLSLLDVFYGFAFFLLVAVVIAYLSTRNKIGSLELLSALEKEKHMRAMTAQAYNEAEQANKAKSNFLSAMSHDLRTPMNAIVGLCTLLNRDSNKPQKVEDYSRKITASSKHLLGLINDILDMSKIESGKVSVNTREFCLGELIDNINNIVRPQAHSRHQAFEIIVNNIEHELLIGDDLRINQILLNLLSNAVKYTQVGGQVRLEVTEGKMHSNNIASFFFTVSDNGMGMSEEYLKHIFEPFSRSNNVINEKIQGTGLGMTITNSLVNLLGGTIDIKSKEKQGTTITVHLSFMIQGNEVNDLDFFKNKGIQNVLVVDDVANDFMSVQSILNDVQVNCYHAVNGKHALDQLKSLTEQNNRPDLILLDLKLENEDGLQVAKQLNSTEFKDIPIILLTSYDYSDIEVEAMDCGIATFLNKPLFISSLKQAIGSITNKEHEDTNDPECNICNVFNGLKVLAAEDNELNSEILVDLLNMRGAICKVCADGVEVVETFKNSKEDEYDLILMDVQMPRLDGLGATKQIRALDKPNAKTIPIIAMTANAFSEDIKASIDAGMNYHVSKPIDFKVLEECIKKVRVNLSNLSSEEEIRSAKIKHKEDICAKCASCSKKATCSRTEPCENDASSKQ